MPPEPLNYEQANLVLNQKIKALEKELTLNASLSRSDLFRRLLDPRRNIDEECGYPAGIVVPSFYQDLYDREAIAARVVEVWPKECWQIQPLVYEVEGKKVTPFEEAWDRLGSSLHGVKSWHKDETGSLVYEYLRRIDILSGIGQFGVLLLGIDDGQPMDTVADSSKDHKLLYLRCFPESMCQITQYENDVNSPRFGQPNQYMLTFNDPRAQYQGGQGLDISTRTVHWSRVVHVADNLASSEVFGIPRQFQVLNRLLDLRKLYSGSAEMYWRGAFPGISLETHPQLGTDVNFNTEETRNQMENYMNGLQRYFALIGVSAKSLAPQVVDPKSQIEVQIEAICIKLSCPIRVFKGSERGELASSQDDIAWNDRLKERQCNYLTPRLVVPFVDRCIALGILPEPSDGYKVEWPDLTSQTATEKTTVLTGRTGAMAQYVGGSVESILPPFDFLTREMGYDEDEATAILESAAREEEKRQQEAMEQQQVQQEQAMAQQEQAMKTAAKLGVPMAAPGVPPKNGKAANGKMPNTRKLQNGQVIPKQTAGRY